MRAPFVAPLGSRDGTLTRDPLTVNGLVEVRGKQVTTLRRPGLLESYDLAAGQAQGTTYWKGTLFAARGNELVQGPTELPVADGSLWEDVTFTGLPAVTSLDTTAFTAFKGAIYAVMTGTVSTSIRVYKSTDGVNFTQLTVTGLPTTSPHSLLTSSISYVRGYELVQDGTYMYLNPTDSPYTTGGVPLYRTSDGVTWTTVTSTMYTQTGYPSASVGATPGALLLTNARYNAKYVYHSTNSGAAWVSQGTVAAWPGRYQDQSYSTVYYGNSWWRYIGTYVWQSTDSGATWTQRGQPSASYDTGLLLVYNNRLFAFSRSNCAVYSSLDGITWTLRNSGIFASGLISGCFVFDNTVYVTTTINNAVVCKKAGITDAGGDLYNLGTGELRLDFTSTGAAAATDYLFLKTTEKAWVLTFGSPGTLTEVTDADFPDNTVPGVVSLDGYIFVMTIDGIIYNSDLEDPLAWNSLNFITAESEPDQGVAIAKHQNYIVALKERTTELFYDAGNATGSPLAAMTNSVYSIGCANGYTIARCDGGLFFLSKTNSQNVSLHYFAPNALTPEELADEAFQRVLSSVDLTDAKAWAGKVAGHVLYVLVLPVEGLTLVYDLTSKLAGKLTLLTAVAAGTPSGIAQVDGLATVTWTAHGCSDGDPVVFSGADQTAYNGTFNVNYVDADHVTFEVAADTVTPATGTLSAVRYTEDYFPFTALVAFNDKNYIQHETNGKLYEFSLDYLTDDGAPINFTVRLPKIDAKTTLLKKAAKVDVVGTQEDAELLVRWSDDDMRTVGKYRRVNLANDPARLRRCGSTRQRVFEFRYTGEPLIRLSAVEIT